MRQHTIIGQRIIGAAPELRSVGAIVRSSHERFDGGDYPDELAGEEIPLGAGGQFDPAVVAAFTDAMANDFALDECAMARKASIERALDVIN